MIPRLGLAAVLGWFVALAAPAAEPWILDRGPEAVQGIPLEPWQPVPAWRGSYTNAEAVVWLYLTESPHFYPPTDEGVRRIAGTRWFLVAFFPESTKAGVRSRWLDLWVEGFQRLAELPDPGWPVVFPSLLKLP